MWRFNYINLETFLLKSQPIHLLPLKFDSVEEEVNFIGILASFLQRFINTDNSDKGFVEFWEWVQKVTSFGGWKSRNSTISFLRTEIRGSL